MLLILGAGIMLQAQNLPHFPKITRAGKGKVNTRIDNIGYWNLMAKYGYVERNPYRVPPPAQQLSSMIAIDGIMVQDSPDIPVVEGDETTQSENAIFIDPNDESILLNSNNSSDWNGAFAQDQYGADWYGSDDAAATWGGSMLGVGQTNMGDPAVAIGRNGWWYVGKINNGRGQSVAYSTNQGQSWTDVTLAMPGTGFGDLLDKNHLWIDNSEMSAYEGNLYAGWSCYVDGSPCENGIQISRSTDQGLSWTIPVCISDHVNAGANNQGINIQTGPGGEVYTAWIIYDTWPSDETAIGFAKSLDGGETWVPANRIITNIKGIRASGTKKDMRVASFPVMTVDLSGGPNNGTIYVVWANIGFPGINTGEDIDIYMIRSTNQGDTWSDPIRVNQDPAGLGKEHFLPWITCDPLNGNLCVIYYDDRNVDSTQVETWVSYSWDGGNTWSDFRVSDVAFTPSPIPGMAADYFGDYIGIKAQNMKVYPIWTDNRTGNALTWVSPFDLGPPPNQPYVTYFSHETEIITDGSENQRIAGRLSGTPTRAESTEGLVFGDSLYLTLGLKNIGDQPATDLSALISTTNPWITITDDTEDYGSMDPGEIKTIPQGYSLKVSDSIPDGLRIRFDVDVTGSDTNWRSHFSMETHAPSLRIVGLTIEDEPFGNDNGKLDPGETVQVIINNVNRGDFEAPDTRGKLVCSSPFITLETDSVYLDTLYPGEPKSCSFTLTVADEAPTGIGITLQYTLNSRYHVLEADFLETIGVVVEDWEAGNFSKFPWQHYGALPWMLNPNDPWEGVFCASSPNLNDYMSSILQVEYTAGVDDSISFYRKTSCEPDYDFLLFYIDDVLQGSWSGDLNWQRVAYPVEEGTHIFKWIYSKDIFMAVGADKVWIDYIEFPPPVLPEVNAGPDASVCEGETYALSGSASGYDHLLWITKGDGTFSSDTIQNPVYTPGPEDIQVGSVKLMLRAYVTHGSTLSSLLLTIQETPEALITAEPKDTLCSWQSGTLSTPDVAGGSWLWMPGNLNSREIIIDTAIAGGLGTTPFSVVVTGSNGCTSSDTLDITFNDCIALDELANPFWIRISPNPSNGDFSLRIHTSVPEIISWRLSSGNNQILLEEKDITISGDYTRQLDLKHLPRGLYLMEVERTEGVITEKVILR